MHFGGTFITSYSSLLWYDFIPSEGCAISELYSWRGPWRSYTPGFQFWAHCLPPWLLSTKSSVTLATWGSFIPHLLQGPRTMSREPAAQGRLVATHTDLGHNSFTFRDTMATVIDLYVTTHYQGAAVACQSYVVHYPFSIWQHFSNLWDRWHLRIYPWLLVWETLW